MPAIFFPVARMKAAYRKEHFSVERSNPYLPQWGVFNDHHELMGRLSKGLIFAKFYPTGSDSPSAKRAVEIAKGYAKLPYSFHENAELARGS